MNMGVHADIGYVGADRQRTHQRPHHQWKLVAQRHGLYRHRCIKCGCIRQRAHGDRITTRYYARGNCSNKAPACIGEVSQ